MFKVRRIIFIYFFLCFFLLSVAFAQELEEVPLTEDISIESINKHLQKEEYLTALDEVKKLPETNESKVLKAKIYCDLDMYSSAKESLENTTGAEAERLKYQVKRENGFIFYPNYSFYVQELADEYDLDFQRYGIYLSEHGPKNSDIYLDYGIYTYNSGNQYHQTNVTNELIGGVHARPNEKYEYDANFGAKFFQFNQGNMIITDSWIKYYFNDKASCRLGFYRDNVQQTYESAVGMYIDNKFVGQAVDNRFYAEGYFKCPHEIRAKVKAAYGLIYAQNMITNQYFDFLFKAEKNVYNNPKNKILQLVDVGMTTNFFFYQYDLLDLYDQKGVLYGGYFSPSFFNGTVLNLSLEGKIDKLKLRYGIKGFVGEQVSHSPDYISIAWGYAPFIEYNLNDHIAINLSYLFQRYSATQRHIFTVNTVFRGFKK